MAQEPSPDGKILSWASEIMIVHSKQAACPNASVMMETLYFERDHTRRSEKNVFVHKIIISTHQNLSSRV